MTYDKILASIFTDSRFRAITINICKQHKSLVEDIMHDTFIVLWENKDRARLEEAYRQNKELVYAFYYKWCWFTFHKNSTQKIYGLSTAYYENRNLTNDRISSISYEILKDEEDRKMIEFEDDLFHKLLIPNDNDTEEENYFKGLLREHMGVSYTDKGKLINTEWKSTRTIDNLTGINYVTVSKDLKEGIKYLYKEWRSEK